MSKNSEDFKSIDEIKSKLHDFVLPGLPTGEVGILHGPGGAGKSFFALTIAAQITSGTTRNLTGFGQLTPGPVFFISLEDKLESIKERFQLIKSDLTEDEQVLTNKKFLVTDNKSNINNKLSKAIETLKIKPRLIIIDHLTYWSQLDLNDGENCKEILHELKLMAKSFNCAVLVIHHANRNALMTGKERQLGSANIGGSIKLQQLARWVASLEYVEYSQLESYGIKNEDTDNYKIFLLDKVNYGTNLKFLLKKQQNGVPYYWLEDSKKITRLTPEEIKKFNMTIVSTELSNLRADTQHIMSWLTQGPCFETVDKKRRSSLTYKNEKGQLEDKDRDYVSIHENIWGDGAVLKIYGPVCDHEDKKLYALLLKELTNKHRAGFSGLILEISMLRILNLLELENTGPNYERVRLQLKRLTRMLLSFEKETTKKFTYWDGPLLTSVYGDGEGRNSQLMISFSPFMISFYRLHEYTLFNKEYSDHLKNNSSAFYFFLSSNLGQMTISVEKCKKLLGISSDVDKNEAVKRIKKALNALIDMGIIDSTKTYVKNGHVVAASLLN